MPSGLVRALFRSRMTSDGALLRISASAPSVERANVIATPSWLAVVLILDVNIRSSRTAKIIDRMIVHVETAGPFQQNGLVFGCEKTSEAGIIDPGDGVEALLDFAHRRSLAIGHILLTHAHIDHVTGVAVAKRALNVPVYLHRDDLFLYDHVVQHGQMFGIRVEPQPPIDLFYTPGQTIAFGELQAAVHHTPGHCPGGVCLAIGGKGGAGENPLVGDER